MTKPRPLYVLPLVRFVRDADWKNRTRNQLIRLFGEPAFLSAVRSRYIRQQVWHGERTEFVDLTPDGERYLRRVAALERREL